MPATAGAGMCAATSCKQATSTRTCLSWEQSACSNCLQERTASVQAHAVVCQPPHCDCFSCRRCWAKPVPWKPAVRRVLHGSCCQRPRCSCPGQCRCWWSWRASRWHSRTGRGWLTWWAGCSRQMAATSWAWLTQVCAATDSSNSMTCTVCACLAGQGNSCSDVTVHCCSCFTCTFRN